MKETDLYKELFERSADASLIIDGDTFIDCNEATVRMLRAESREQVLRMHPSQLSPPTQPDGRPSFQKANEMIAKAFAQGSHRFEWTHRRVDGEDFPVDVLLTSLRTPDRDILHVVWRDLTERKLLEEHLRHSQKMEAVGRLAGGIAHDFNNLLVVVSGHTELLGIELGDEPHLASHLRSILMATDRAAELIKRLLAFGRRHDLTLQVIDVGPLLADAEGLLSPLLEEAIDLRTETSPGPLTILADRTQIEQLLINLTVNARDAMPRGGTLVLRAYRAADASSEAPADPEGSWVVLAFEGDGGGMDEDTRNRAFEPLYTTTPTGAGTGLGLAAVRGIVEQLGGRMVIDSVEGGGTTLYACLPFHDGAPNELADTPKGPHPRGTETVLLVEDEPGVANLVTTLLKRQGYRLLTARDGVEGEACYLRHADDIDLVLTDVIMPRRSGPKMVQALRDKGHRPRVLFMSGYTGDALDDVTALGTNPYLLAKPFHARGLTERVRAALDEATPS